MGAAPVPKFVRSLALDFPEVCLQFFMEILAGRKKTILHTTLYIFTRLPTRQDGLQDRDYRNDSILRPPSNKRPISNKSPL